MTAADRANRPVARLFRFRNSGRRVGTNISAQARSRPRFGRCAARSRHLPNPPVHLDGREEPRELTSLSGSYSVGDLIPALAGECWQVVSVRPEGDGLTGLMCDLC